MKIFIFLAIFVLSQLSAHKLNIFLSNEDSTVHIFSYFSSGSKCQNCNFMVKNSGKIIFEGKLNDEGKYDYTSKEKNIEVIVDGGAGHVAKETIEVSKPHIEKFSTYEKKQKEQEYIKIVISLVIIAFIFFILKLIMKLKRKHEK